MHIQTISFDCFCYLITLLFCYVVILLRAYLERSYLDRSYLVALP